MRMGVRLKARTAERFTLLTLGLFLLSCLVGLYAGGALALRQSALVVPELQRYFAAYSAVAKDAPAGLRTVLQSVFLYFRYPVLVFLLGFASFGMVLIPPITSVLAFSFSYAVCCFVAALGTEGVTLALALLGLRYLLTLPCCLVLAVPALRTSWELTRCTFGRGARRGGKLFDRAYLWRFLLVSAVLAAGVLLDLWLTPWLLELVT